MYDLLKITLLGLFFGTFGTTIGGAIGANLNIKSNKFLSFILSLSSGLMLAIISFSLIPEAMNQTNMSNVILGLFMGITAMIICSKLIDKKLENNGKISNLLKMGIIVSIGLAIHNFPEGLAIGSGFGASIKLGISLAIAICLHDIPEGRFQNRISYQNA